ncbi:ETS homologous factor-like isoform X1 [Gasterosteus aculeatus]
MHHFRVRCLSAQSGDRVLRAPCSFLLFGPLNRCKSLPCGLSPLGHGISECRGYNMSISPFTTLESPLTSSWSPTNSYPDVATWMSGYSNRLWPRDPQPQLWSKFQVWEWLQQVMDINQIDASSVPFQNFDMDGHQLCGLSYQDFIHAADSAGPVLFHSITELKWSGQCHVELGHLELKPELDFSCSFSEVSYPPADLYSPSLPPIAPIASLTPSSPGEECTSYTIQQDIKRSLSRQVKKHNPRGIHLWEFIRDILLNPEWNSGLIKWEDRAEGVFRFLKSDAVAQLWGKKKNNISMTYEKLSRAMRYYYKREILERVDGRRLVYKFGRNARGWRESDM